MVAMTVDETMPEYTAANASSIPASSDLGRSAKIIQKISDLSRGDTSYACVCGAISGKDDVYLDLAGPPDVQLRLLLETAARCKQKVAQTRDTRVLKVFNHYYPRFLIALGQSGGSVKESKLSMSMLMLDTKDADFLDPALRSKLKGIAGYMVEESEAPWAQLTTRIQGDVFPMAAKPAGSRREQRRQAREVNGRDAEGGADAAALLAEARELMRQLPAAGTQDPDNYAFLTSAAVGEDGSPVIMLDGSITDLLMLLIWQASAYQRPPRDLSAAQRAVRIQYARYLPSLAVGIEKNHTPRELIQMMRAGMLRPVD